MEKWPNFFIVGAPRCGTSSLHEYLNSSEEVLMSPIKEPNYFSVKTVPADYSRMRIIRDQKEYLDLFKNAVHTKIFGESSATYFYDPDAPRLIHDKIPDAKILISLRDPVERAFSSYLKTMRVKSKISFHDQIIKEMRNEEDPNEPVRVVKNSLYYESLRRYYNFFGEKNVKVVIFEEFIENVKNTLKDIYKFLGVAHKPELRDEVHNKFVTPRSSFAEYLIRTGTTKQIGKILPYNLQKFLSKKIIYDERKPKPKIDESDRKFLVDYFKDDVLKVSNFLNRELPWKNFPEVN